MGRGTSGLLRFDYTKINWQTLKKRFVSWEERINNGDCKATFNYLNHSYYDGYLNNILPEVRYEWLKKSVANRNFLNHLTMRVFADSESQDHEWFLHIHDGKNIPFRIEYIDLYLFPHEIAVFSLKLIFTSEYDLNLGSVSDFTNKVRYLQSKISSNKTGITTIGNFVKETVIAPLNPDNDWQIYNPQLKSYIQIDLNEQIDQETLDHLLFDIGNVSLIGSANGEGLFAPSESYYKEQIENNKISVFRNWAALSLYDTFTRISINFPDRFKSWEYDYFNLYIYCLYLKFFMYLTNSEISNVTEVSKNTEKIRNRFVEFVNDYYHTQISYKFLPDLMKDKLMYSLEINSEIKQMEKKVQRINEHFQEKSQKSFNRALITITFLSVVSVITGFSDWIVQLGLPKKWMYPYISVGIGIIIIALIYYIFKGKKT